MNRYIFLLLLIFLQFKAWSQEKLKIDSINAYQRNLENQGLLSKLRPRSAGKDLYNQIKTYNSYPRISSQLISMQIKLNDTLHNSFLVVLPKNYHEKHRYPLLFFLHGAVQGNTRVWEYSDGEDTSGWNRYYTKFADRHNVIMVYPNGNRDYNWMSPDKGFFMVPAILKQIKNVVNVDDEKVFISGHSNGATGAFSYAMKQPSAFAGFYGFNTRPRVATGGTYVRNLLNRSFFNVSTDQDYYYPPSANDSLNHLMKMLGADYQDHRFNGFPHWFPAFHESEPAFKLLFDDLVKRKRNSFRSALQWECDDTKYGRCDWISITSLDTLAKRANWHIPSNFQINKWVLLNKSDEPVVRDTSLQAFNYKKRSGALRATYQKNTFKIESSRVGRIRIYISPDMVDIRKEITIWLNGAVHFKAMVRYRPEVIWNEFTSTLDREAIWIDYIDIST
jgi:pimeloyl-ACP methyl ester carboxylesterase